MQEIMEKAKRVKLLILDVDGTLTNGIIYYNKDGAEERGFHVHDGFGIQLLQKAGIQVAVISAKDSETVKKRLSDLQIEHAYLGQEDKLPAYETLKQALHLTDTNIAYMGDDLPDLPLLCRAGFAITVPNAPAIIQQKVDYISKKKAGKGAVRELCNLILDAQGLLEPMLQSYLK